MNIEWMRQHCLSFPHATENIQWVKDLVFKVGGKMFALTGIGNVPPTVNLKCDPERGIELRERYDALIARMKEVDGLLAQFVVVDPISKAELKALLPADTALVQYMIADEELFAWVVRDGEIRGVATKLDVQALRQRIRDFRVLMQNKYFTGFACTCSDCLQVKWQQSSQIEDVNRNVCMLGSIFFGPVHTRSVSNNAQLIATQHLTGFSDLYGIIFFRHRTAHASV